MRGIVSAGNPSKSGSSTISGRLSLEIPKMKTTILRGLVLTLQLLIGTHASAFEIYAGFEADPYRKHQDSRLQRPAKPNYLFPTQPQKVQRKATDHLGQNSWAEQSSTQQITPQESTKTQSEQDFNVPRQAQPIAGQYRVQQLGPAGKPVMPPETAPTQDSKQSVAGTNRSSLTPPKDRGP
jgi:hypothetical protein